MAKSKRSAREMGMEPWDVLNKKLGSMVIFISTLFVFWGQTPYGV